ncbi:cuticle protein 7-like [Penaeus indicus]|uniref:cuticle protein 7-like n=1 Tax=Penaeus indicus TaxID=29960 RepID=UPI00300C045B
MLFKVAAMMMMVNAALPFPSDMYAPAPQPQHMDGMPYNFAYAVKDQYSGNDFSHNEDSDGKNVMGTYSVQLPDGRKQTVNYKADHSQGYLAEVNYLGEAQYPHVYGPAVTFKPQPSYNPQPQPEPAPSYEPQPVEPPQPSYQPQPVHEPEPVIMAMHMPAQMSQSMYQ